MKIWMRWLWVVAVVAACQTPQQAVIDQSVTQQCPTQTVEGIDVYAGDGTIDWMKVKSSGREFAFIKATQGDYNKQATFAANWAGAAAAGLVRSPYHFFDPTIDGKAQAQWFLDEITAGGGLGSADLPAMLDIECPTSSSQSGASPNCEYTGNSGWAPTATMIQRIFDWLDAVETATGKKAIVYSYVSWFSAVGFTDARLTDYPLFIASYNQCASVPAPWTSAVFWQYSASGIVPGITPQVDLDRFIGSSGDLVGLTGAMPDAGVGGDAGVPPDAGNPETGGAGCGCRSSGLGTIAWVLLAIPYLMHRRARSRRRTPSSGRRTR